MNSFDYLRPFADSGAKWSMRIALIIAGAMLASVDEARAQDIECQQLKTLEQDLLANLPVAVDDLTRLVGLNVNCVAREIDFVKHLTIPEAALEDDALEIKQMQYRQLHCNSHGFARRGWTARDYIYDRDLKLVMELEATPRMC